MTKGMGLLLLRRAEIIFGQHEQAVSQGKKTWEAEGLFIHAKVLVALVVKELGKDFYKNQAPNYDLKGYAPEETMSDSQAVEMGDYAVNLTYISPLLPSEGMAARACICAGLVRLIEIYKGDEFAAKYRKAVVGGGEAADSAKTGNQCKESSQCVATHTGHPKPSQTAGDTS